MSKNKTKNREKAKIQKQKSIYISHVKRAHQQIKPNYSKTRENHQDFIRKKKVVEVYMVKELQRK